MSSSLESKPTPAPTAPGSQSVVRSPWSVVPWWSIVLPLALFSVLWLDLIRQLSYMWETSEEYAFGWFVPILALGLFIQKWFSRPGVTGVTTDHRPLTTDRWLIGLVVLIAFFLLPVRVIHEVNQDFALFSWLLALTVVALTLYAVFLWGGWPWVKHFAFPICFILVAVRWPYRIENSLTYRLMSVVTSVTVELLGWLGVPTLQHGHLIEVATGTVGVDEACSGIRSFQSSLMAGLFMGELYRLRTRWRVVLVVSGLALAFCFNVTRTMFLTWEANAHGLSAIDKWHDSAGKSIAIACIISLWLLALLISKWTTGKQDHGTADHGITDHGTTDHGPRTADCGLQTTDHGPRTADCGATSPRPSPPAERGAVVSSPSTVSGQSSVVSGQWSVVSKYLLLVGLWSILCIAATETWYRSHETNLAPTATWWAQFPTNLPSAREIPMTKLVRSKLKFDQGTTLAWDEPDGTKWTAFCFRWDAGVATSRMSARDHRPEYCLGGSGYNCQADFGVHYLPAHGMELPFRTYIFDRSGVVLYVFHCLWEDGATKQKGFGTSKYLDRLETVLEGKRRMGQQTLEIIVSGYPGMTEAEAAVRQRLPSLIQAGAAPSQL